MLTRQDIIKAVQEFAISANEVNRLFIDKILLFGSYAKGNPNKYSDIDLAVFSRQFCNTKIISAVFRYWFLLPELL